MTVLRRFDDWEGITYVLWERVWTHIREGHLEIKTPDELGPVLAEPDVVVRSNWSDTGRLYYKRIGKYYRTVVVDTEEQRVKTAYVTDAIKSGDTIWKRTPNVDS